MYHKPVYFLVLCLRGEGKRDYLVYGGRPRDGRGGRAEGEGIKMKGFFYSNTF